MEIFFSLIIQGRENTIFLEWKFRGKEKFDMGIISGISSGIVRSHRIFVDQIPLNIFLDFLFHFLYLCRVVSAWFDRTASLLSGCSWHQKTNRKPHGV
jgi:hypothetical protein